MIVPSTVLTLAYWLHMLATVLWVGGISALALLVIPAARRAMDPLVYAAFLEKIQRRLDPMGWGCLVILAATGLVQMSANPHYRGFLDIQNRWAEAILIKHILFLGMAGLAVTMSWGVLPGLRRLAMQQNILPQDKLLEAAGKLSRQEARLLRLSLVLAGLVLALTAVARAT